MKTVYELDPAVRERAAAAYAEIRGHPIDWAFAPDRAWIEGYAGGAAAHQPALTQAAQDVLAERRRQVEVKGWTPEHDDEHDTGELAAAGAAYTVAAADELYPLSLGDGNYRENCPPCWPAGWPWKPDDPRRMLVKGAALILAEIERLDRVVAQEPKP